MTKRRYRKLEKRYFPTIEEFNVPKRVSNSLISSGINNLLDLVNTSKKDLLKIRGIGVQACFCIAMELLNHGIQWKPVLNCEKIIKETWAKHGRKSYL